MNVLIVQHTAEMGGAALYVNDVAKGLHSKDCQIHLVTGPGDLVESYQQLSVKTTIRSPQGIVDLAYIRWLRDYIKAQKIDVVYAHLIKGATHSLLASKWAGVPCITNLHSSISDWELPWYRKLFDIVINTTLTNLLAAKAIAISHDVRRKMILREGVWPWKIQVIYNGVDTNTFKPQPNHSWRKKWGIEASRPVVGYMGRLSYEKGVDSLVDVAAQLKRASSQAAIVIAGAGQQQEELQQAIAHHQLQNYVYLVGSIPPHGRVEVYNNFDVLAFTSRREGFGLTLVEAMACGIPVVGYQLPVTREIFTAPNISLLIPHRNPKELATIINRLLLDKNKLQTMKQSCRQHAQDNFSLEHFLTKTKKLIHEVG